MRPGTARASCSGSVPPISRWPVSRHSLIFDPQHAVHLAAGLDHGPDVRMQHREHAAIRGRRRRAGRDWPAALPIGRRRVWAANRIRRCPSPRPAPERSPRKPPAHRAGAAMSGSGSCPASCSSTGTKVPTQLSPYESSSAVSSSGSDGRKPSGPNSVADRPTSRISASTRSGVELMSPAGHLAHTPGDRRACDFQVHVISPLRYVTGTPRCNDSVAASASHATSTASATVHAGAACP